MRLLQYSLVMLVALGVSAVLIVGNASAQESSATGLMARANERYERGEYAEAAQQYEALIDRGYSDAALYFNLGNAYLENGDLGRAILNYLRARELSPRDPDIRDNLDLARGMTADGIAAERGPLIESLSYFGHRWGTPDELGTVAILLWAASGVSIGALLVWRVFPLRRGLRAATIFATVAAAMAPSACGEHDVRQSLRQHRRGYGCGSRDRDRAGVAVSRGVHLVQRSAGARCRPPARLA